MLKKYSLPTLFFMFFNLTEFNHKTITFSASYKGSKFDKETLTQKTTEYDFSILNKVVELDGIVSSTGKIDFTIFNPGHNSASDFLEKVYLEIQRKRISTTKVEFEKQFVLALFLPRGSIDFTGNFIATDIYEKNESPEYINNLMSLMLNLSCISQLNFNFRNLQPDYVSGKRERNTQIRINLRYFYDTYLQYAKSYLPTKYERILSREDFLLNKNIKQDSTAQIIERMIFFREHILDSNAFQSTKDKTKLVEELRKKIEFDKKDIIRRNYKIVDHAIYLFPDVCVGCHDKYPIEDRTFKRRNNDLWYLEIHHVLPFSKDSAGDVIENLVKLCPTCHRALTKNRAEEDLQKELISNILKEKNVNQYIEQITGLALQKDKIDYIYNELI